jgi:hypothetical protein
MSATKMAKKEQDTHTVHSNISCNSPYVSENTKPPTGFPRKRRIVFTTDPSRKEKKLKNKHTIPVSPMRIQLSSCVSLWNINFCQIPGTSDLNEIRCLDKVSAQDNPIWDDTGTITRFQTPGNFDTLFTE